MKVLVFKPERCDGCGICEETCSRTWFKEATAERSAIRISKAPGEPVHYEASICNQCGECIDICQTMALWRDKRGIVRIKKKLCAGCVSCVGFCPTLTMHMLPGDAVPFKCVACGECADACPAGALSIEILTDAELSETEKRLKVVA